MSQEEERELKDLVTQCLAAKGFLAKIQAEIRAGVFVALEEGDVFKEKNPFLNKKLKDFTQTTDGGLIISLVREFIEFFELEFTAVVFDPETHAGVDYKYEGRSKIAKDLNLNDEGHNLPLLGLLLKTLRHNNHNEVKNINNLLPQTIESQENNIEIDSSLSNLINLDNSRNHIPGNVFNRNNVISENDKILRNGDVERIILDQSITPLKKETNGNLVINEETEEYEMLKSLSILPPLEKNSSKDSKSNMNQLNSLLNFDAEGGDENYEEDFVSSESEKKKERSESIGSEIEEELPSHSNHSNPNDETIDLSVSRASGHADYSEDIST